MGLRKLYPNDQVAQKAWMKLHQKRVLDKGKIETLVLALRAIDSTNAELLEKISSVRIHPLRSIPQKKENRHVHLWVAHPPFLAWEINAKN